MCLSKSIGERGTRNMLHLVVVLRYVDSSVRIGSFAGWVGGERRQFGFSDIVCFCQVVWFYEGLYGIPFSLPNLVPCQENRSIKVTSY